MDKVSLGPRPYLTAMPIVLVGANVEGKPNYMAVAWAGVACMDPPMIAVAINKVRHTEKGIAENGTFSVNIPSSKQSVETDHCGIVSGGKEDKSAIFDTFYGKLETAPLIGEFPVNIECRLGHTLELGSHNLHVGEVVDVHVDRDCLTNNLPDHRKIDAMVYAGNEYSRIGEVVSKAFSVGRSYKKK
ncbi:MAG: flavin reductase family protein [Methanomassiliicoccus sp.]|nr:flavin reductase family protein [Methanomassiliicoccus sp.]